MTLVTTTGCSFVVEDLPECPNQLRVKFNYDYNLSNHDAFAREVNSVNVWAFDNNGMPVWSEEVSGDILKEKDFIIETPLPEGNYDFIAWCGLLDNNAFELTNYNPLSKEELEVKLNIIDEEGLNICNKRLQPLFHAYAPNQNYQIDYTIPYYQDVTLSLMKDTKNFRVMLQQLDGTEINSKDFTVSIETRDAWMDWNNNIPPDSPLVTYKPWDVKYGQTNPEGEAESRVITSVSTLLFELSTGRLIKDIGATLSVRRNTDGQDIIRINLIDYLLLIKGHYDETMTDQEYLDRADDFALVFFLDPDNNWYMANGIYINGWEVLPPQDEDI